MLLNYPKNFRTYIEKSKRVKNSRDWRKIAVDRDPCELVAN